MSGKVKNQHYVPQMYLKRFSADNKHLDVWDVKKNIILPRQQFHNFAARRFFYDADKPTLRELSDEMIFIHPVEVNSVLETNNEQLVEHMLSRSEADAALILDEINRNHSAVYKKQNMQKLIIFLHDLAYRTEKFRDKMEMTHKQLIVSLSKLGVSSKDMTEKAKTGKEIQLYQLLGIKPLYETTKMLMEQYSWYIGIISGDRKLIISDNPAQGIMLGFNDICIPISGEKAIIFRANDIDTPLISKDMPKGNEILLSDRSVFAYNAYQFSNANRFMFGDKESMKLLKIISNK